ncbi:hypothetical protein [Bacillus licheniformis]|uniref:hypothetical protein n=1 Tax=Bacillus licheniformis TaxID=1402 RepID=UPI001F43BF95|nr:hypothetical protein [Bacillus licheniformis]
MFQTDGCVNANHKAKALTIELTSVDFESLQMCKSYSLIWEYIQPFIPITTLTGASP